MSVISRISVFSHCNDLGGKLWNPAIKWTKKYAVFVLLEDDQGCIGLGECWCFDSSPDVLVAFLRTEVIPHFIGIDIADADRQIQRLNTRSTLTARHGILASALSGVDIALWDLRSRRADLPLWAYLQQESNTIRVAANGSVYLYASGGLYGEGKGIEDLVLETQDMCRAGFNTVKIKLGALSESQDLERAQGVFDGLDDSCSVIIDGVYSYSVAQARRVFNALPSKRLEAFQSPLIASDLTGMKSLTDSGIPVMACEAEYREEIHQQMIEQKSVRFFQVSPIACGGISRLKSLAHTIENQHHSEFEMSLEISSTAIALMAACHFAAAFHNCVAHTEYHYVHQVFFDELNLKTDQTRPGWYQLADKPGLGITLPMSSVKSEFVVHT